MRHFYQITQRLHDLLIADANINVVTIGDISDVDLSKQTVFPLAHIVIGDANLNGSTTTMNFTVVCMDIVDITKNDIRDEDEPFYGTNDLQDIWNTQLAVCNRLIENLRRGSSYNEGYQITGSVTATPFKDRFENLLAGWAIDIAVDMPNTEICV